MRRLKERPQVSYLLGERREDHELCPQDFEF
jgi:hypothetical protein